MRTTIFLLSLLALGATAAHKAWSHDWYPPGCCHEIKMADGTIVSGDCGPADLVGQTPEGTVLRQRQTGLVVTIPPNFPKDRIHPNTHDGQYHICVRTTDKYIYCVFDPAGT